MRYISWIFIETQVQKIPTYRFLQVYHIYMKKKNTTLEGVSRGTITSEDDESIEKSIS